MVGIHLLPFQRIIHLRTEVEVKSKVDNLSACTYRVISMITFIPEDNWSCWTNNTTLNLKLQAKILSFWVARIERLVNIGEEACLFFACGCAIREILLERVQQLAFNILYLSFISWVCMGLLGMCCSWPAFWPPQTLFPNFIASSFLFPGFQVLGLCKSVQHLPLLFAFLRDKRKDHKLKVQGCLRFLTPTNFEKFSTLFYTL